MNFSAVVGRVRFDFKGEMVESGRVLEGSERMRVLRDSKGFRFFSLSTALSRYGSRTHLILAFMKVRMWWRRRWWWDAAVAE